jgi:hypothetical protein
MSFNPDDKETLESEQLIQQLREENSELSRQVAELTTRLSRYEIQDGAATTNNARTSSPTTNDRAGVGRKSIPFNRRNARQHQGRMAYLLKKLETKQSWTLDAIADLQAYCTAADIAGAGRIFYDAAVLAYAGENGHTIVPDLDTFIAMIQS